MVTLALGPGRSGQPRRAVYGESGEAGPTGSPGQAAQKQACSAILDGMPGALIFDQHPVSNIQYPASGSSKQQHPRILRD